MLGFAFGGALYSSGNNHIGGEPIISATVHSISVFGSKAHDPYRVEYGSYAMKFDGMRLCEAYVGSHIVSSVKSGVLVLIP
jgi:hypothetical protein